MGFRVYGFLGWIHGLFGFKLFVYVAIPEGTLPKQSSAEVVVVKNMSFQLMKNP